jgi:hypothetical protein
MMDEKQYPECEKLAKVSEQSQKIGEFIDWLGWNKGYHISFYPKDEETHAYPRLAPIIENTEQLLADYFEIDLKKVEEERRAILKGLQEK